MRLDDPDLTEHRDLWPHDICLFLEDTYITEAKKPIRLDDWQKEYILQPIFGDHKEDGSRKYSLAIIGVPKKNGKSCLAAGVALYMLLFDEPAAEVYSIARDEDQARIIFGKARSAVQRSPIYSQWIEVRHNRLIVAKKESVYQVLSADAPSAHGLNPSCVIADELWNQPNRDLWDALAESPTRKNPLRFVVTYAGWDQSSLLYDLYKKCLPKDLEGSPEDQDIIVSRGEGEFPDAYMFWSHKNLAEGSDWWQRKDYLTRRRRELPPHIYQRMHQNKWVQGAGAFLTQAQVEGCIDEGLTERLMPEGNFTYYAAVDLGLKKDRTARAIGHYDPATDSVVLDSMRVWEGTSGSPVVISEVEEDLIDKCQRFPMRMLVCDPWQFTRSKEELQRYVQVEEFIFSSTSVSRLASTLFQLISSGKLKLYRDEGLIQELLSVEARDTTAGWRIDHKATGHDDRVIALGMMAQKILESGRYEPRVRWLEPEK